MSVHSSSSGVLCETRQEQTIETQLQGNMSPLFLLTMCLNEIPYAYFSLYICEHVCVECFSHYISEHACESVAVYECVFASMRCPLRTISWCWWVWWGKLQHQWFCCQRSVNATMTNLSMTLLYIKQDKTHKYKSFGHIIHTESLSAENKGKLLHPRPVSDLLDCMNGVNGHPYTWPLVGAT